MTTPLPEMNLSIFFLLFPFINVINSNDGTVVEGASHEITVSTLSLYNL